MPAAWTEPCVCVCVLCVSVQPKLEGAVTAGVSRVLAPHCNISEDYTLRSLDLRTGQTHPVMLYTSDVDRVEVTVVKNVNEACRVAFKRPLAGKGLGSQDTTLSSYVLARPERRS